MLRRGRGECSARVVRGRRRRRRAPIKRAAVEEKGRIMLGRGTFD